MKRGWWASSPAGLAHIHRVNETRLSHTAEAKVRRAKSLIRIDGYSRGGLVGGKSRSTAKLNAARDRMKEVNARRMAGLAPVRVQSCKCCKLSIEVREPHRQYHSLCRAKVAAVCHCGRVRSFVSSPGIYCTRCQKWMRASKAGSASVKSQAGKRIEFLDRKGRLWRMRSWWEVNYAKWLDVRETEWFYEPCEILLSDGRGYHPDFFVSEFGCYVEIKGLPYRLDKVLLAREDGYRVELIQDSSYFYIRDELISKGII